MVKIYFDYHWWGYTFHKTVLNGFISNDKILDLSRKSWNTDIVVPSTNVEANRLHTPGVSMNGYMESKEYRIKV